MLIAVALLALPLLSVLAITAGRRDAVHGLVYAGAFLCSMALIAAGLEHLGGRLGGDGSSCLVSERDLHLTEGYNGSDPAH